MLVKLLIIVFLPVSLFAQNWSLQQCIDSALVNNINIKKTINQLAIGEVNLKSSKYSLFPTINGNATHGYNWGQTIDPFTNQFATKRVQFDNYYLSSSVDLFTGLRNYYEIKLAEVDNDSYLINKKIEERNLKMEITAAYMQVLLNYELLDVSNEFLELSKKQRLVVESLIKVNYKTEISILEIDAQIANDNFSVIKAKNELNYSLLLLQQLINLEYSPTFNIQRSDTIFQEESITNNYVNSELLDMKIIDLMLEKKALNIQLTKGLLYPTIKLKGALGSGYSANSTFLSSNGDLLIKPFKNQLNENLYRSLSINLSIPIFNQNSIQQKLQVDKIELEQAKLDKLEEKVKIKNKIEQLRFDISNAKAQYIALKLAYNTSKFNFESAKIKLENFVITYTQYLEFKEKLFELNAELIRSKFSVIFKTKILNIYLDE